MDYSSLKAASKPKPAVRNLFLVFLATFILILVYLGKDITRTTLPQRSANSPLNSYQYQFYRKVNGYIMIAIPIKEQRGYLKFTASILKKTHAEMLKHTHVFYSEELKTLKDAMQKWYGTNVTFHRHQRANNLLGNVFEILEYFKESGYENLLIASSDLVLTPNIFHFIEDNVNRTNLLLTYRNSSSCDSAGEGLCAEPNARIIGSVMKKPVAGLLLQNPSWLKDNKGFDVIVEGGHLKSKSPNDSLSVRIGQTIEDDKCTRYAESRNFDRCQFSAEFQRGIEFYYDKCNPSTVYFECNSSANIDAFYSKPAVVYSLYGGSPRYTDGVSANCKLMSSVYPEWQMWVYHDKSVPQKIMKILCKCDAKLVDLTESNITNKRTWRFSIASEKVHRYIVRDIDSRLSLRERAAVEEWINSSKKFHVMRDHPAHRNFAMNAGMWGGVYGALPNITQMIKDLILNGNKYQDQHFLTSNVWPIASKSVYQHDSFPSKYGEVHPFPTPREGYEHVGSIYVHGKPRQGEIDGLKKFLDSMQTQS